jgi:hypothetical protein
MITITNSKRRMLELMNRVNKINLTESVVDDNLSTSFGMLSNDSFRAGGSGRCNVKTQKSDDGMFIEFNCVDDVKNQYLFIFHVVGGGDVGTDGVYTVNDILLKEYKYTGINGNVSALSGDKLSEFNNQNSESYFDVINKYVEIDFESNEMEDYN